MCATLPAACLNGSRNLENRQHIIFFDGVCNLCNSSVQIVIKNDKKQIFQFSALQSEFAGSFFNLHNFKLITDSIVYWNGKHFYSRSNAALRIASRLRFPYPLLVAGFIVPAFIRNALYDVIARNRYKWFGRQESCMLPTPELKARFLEK